MCARDERTATASGADVLSCGKKRLKKSVGGGGRGGIQPSLGARFLFHSICGAFPCLNFSKLCGTSPLIRFFYPSNAIRYTKSTDLITGESIALIIVHLPCAPQYPQQGIVRCVFLAPYILHLNVSKFVPDLINLRCSKFIPNSTLALSKLLRAWMHWFVF